MKQREQIENYLYDLGVKFQTYSNRIEINSSMKSRQARDILLYLTHRNIKTEETDKFFILYV